MNKNLKDAFQNAKYIPNIDLVDSTWQNIIIHNKKITLIKLGVFSSIGALSLIGLIPALKTLFSEFSKSGFYEYFSILFSNNSGFSSYWKELAYSLAESLPIINIIYAFVLVFTLFLSLKYVARQIIKNRISISGYSSLSY